MLSTAAATWLHGALAEAQDALSFDRRNTFAAVPEVADEIGRALEGWRDSMLTGTTPDEVIRAHEARLAKVLRGGMVGPERDVGVSVELADAMATFVAGALSKVSDERDLLRARVAVLEQTRMRPGEDEPRPQTGVLPEPSPELGPVSRALVERAYEVLDDSSLTVSDAVARAQVLLREALA